MFSLHVDALKEGEILVKVMLGDYTKYPMVEGFCVSCKKSVRSSEHANYRNLYGVQHTGYVVLNDVGGRYKEEIMCMECFNKEIQAA